MPAHSNAFPWPSHYGNFRYFEGAIGAHSNVASISSTASGVYEIVRKKFGDDKLKIFICECYSFGVAEYLETAQLIGELDAIIINSVWCGYTAEVKKFCRDLDVGVFKIGDFMAALNKPKLWLHLNPDELEYFQKKGWA